MWEKLHFDLTVSFLIKLSLNILKYLKWMAICFSQLPIYSVMVYLHTHKQIYPICTDVYVCAHIYLYFRF